MLLEFFLSFLFSGNTCKFYSVYKSSAYLLHVDRVQKIVIYMQENSDILCRKYKSIILPLQR